MFTAEFFLHVKPQDLKGTVSKDLVLQNLASSFVFVCDPWDLCGSYRDPLVKWENLSIRQLSVLIHKSGLHRIVVEEELLLTKREKNLVYI